MMPGEMEMGVAGGGGVKGTMKGAAHLDAFSDAQVHFSPASTARMMRRLRRRRWRREKGVKMMGRRGGGGVSAAAAVSLPASLSVCRRSPDCARTCTDV